MFGFGDFLNSNGLWGLSWMTWIGLYLCPGLGYSVFHLIKIYRERPSQFARDMLAAIGKKKTFRDHLGSFFVYTIAVTCITFAWPAFLVWAYFQSKRDAAWEIERDKPDFNCLPKHLMKRVDPHDAEIASYVIDPLGTVPSLPFGHLNAGWVNFLSQMLESEDEIWSFHIPKGGEHGKHRFAASSDIRGYAKVRNGEILGEFIYESD